MKWRHYADHQLAPLGRSQGGAIKAIIKWLHMGDRIYINPPPLVEDPDRFYRSGEK